jgi:ABC-type molybdate transport system permease subunit
MRTINPTKPPLLMRLLAGIVFAVVLAALVAALLAGMALFVVLLLLLVPVVIGLILFAWARGGRIQVHVHTTTPRSETDGKEPPKLPLE